MDMQKDNPPSPPSKEDIKEDIQNDPSRRDFYDIPPPDKDIPTPPWQDPGDQLFRMSQTPTIGLEQFDMWSPELRKKTAIRVLEILRDSGEVDWDTALVDAGIIKRGGEWE